MRQTSPPSALTARTQADSRCAARSDVPAPRTRSASQASLLAMTFLALASAACSSGDASGAADGAGSGADAAGPAAPDSAAGADSGAPAGGADISQGGADTSPLPSTCTPGERRCDGNQLATCASDGRSWSTTACPAGCAAGACASCTPNTRLCDGNTVVQCLPDGSGTQAVTQCAADRLCLDGLCFDCSPGSRRCNGTVIETCGDDGAWTAAADCAPQGLACSLGACAPACSRDPKARTNAGCEYWAADLDNLGDAISAQYAVIVSNLGTIPATVTVTKRDGASSEPVEVMQRPVAPGSLEILALPARNMTNPGVHWAGYRVVSTAPVVAYQFNPLENVGVYSNDASLLLPVDTFAAEYIIMSRKQVQGADRPFRGAFNVVAAGSATDVTITPTARTQAGGGVPALNAGQSHTVTLEPYQVLNVKTDLDGADLTGTIVTANRPIGVFGGHEGAPSSTRCCVDHLEHQLYPVSTWGTSYIAARSELRGVAPDYWRVVAAEDGTRVTFTPAVQQPVTLNRGKFIDFPATADFVITADKPVMVGQVLASSGEILRVEPGTDCTNDSDCDPGYLCEIFGGGCLPPACSLAGSTAGCPSGHVCACPQGNCSCQPLGDPSLILVPPTQQYRDSYVFLSPNQYAFDYINIVAPFDAAVTLDGLPVPANRFSPIGAEWKVARIPVADGVHKVTANKPVGVIAYGFDDDVSYGYAAGLNLVDRAP
jgi:hypothetical protein